MSLSIDNLADMAREIEKMGYVVAQSDKPECLRGGTGTEKDWGEIKLISGPNFEVERKSSGWSLELHNFEGQTRLKRQGLRSGQVLAHLKEYAPKQ